MSDERKEVCLPTSDFGNRLSNASIASFVNLCCASEMLARGNTATHVVCFARNSTRLNGTSTTAQPPRVEPNANQ